jgi:hypothetical protein
MKRATLGFLTAIALTACATAPAPPPFNHLRGCWIERRADGVTATMRWVRQSVSDWKGDQLTYFPSGGEPAHQGYRLQQEQTGDWLICPLDDSLPHGAPCRIVSDKVLELGNDYRATIAASAERLRIAFVDEGEDHVLFEGARDGCE